MSLSHIIQDCPRLRPFASDAGLPKSFGITKAVKDGEFHLFAHEKLTSAAQQRSERRARGDALIFGNSPDASLISDDRFLWKYWRLDAAHEAGHAIVAFALGWRPKFIRVSASELDSIPSRYENAEGENDWRKLPQEKWHDYWDCEIAMKAGGIAAQKFLVLGALDFTMAKWDFREAVDLSVQMVDPFDDRTEPLPVHKYIITRAASRAEEIVGQNREAVLDVACEALKASALGGKRIEEIFKERGVKRLRDCWLA